MPVILSVTPTHAPTSTGEILADICILLGCIGMFLYGMNLMSGGIQKLAGDKMRTFLGSMTSNAFKRVLTGAGVTALVQSSTATTLMLVSFVNAGLLSLANAIGVIMGANIGTTVTAWIFAFGMGGFSLGSIALPLLFVAFLCNLSKKSGWRNFGEFITGFGLLFLGLTLLKETSTQLLYNNAVEEFLRPFTGFGPYYVGMPMGSVLLFMVIGACMTLMLQSSAATMAITMMLLAGKIIPFPIAAAMVLGENIGTTITSNIAAMSANVSAKRTARAHMLFNLFGVAWVTCILPFFLRFIGWVVESLGFINPMTATPEQLASEEFASLMPFVVAGIHSIFNIVNTCILIWFVPTIERIVTWMVPSPKGEEEVFRLKYINSGMIPASAELSLNEAKNEIVHYAEICHKDFGYVRSAVNATEEDKFEDMNKKLVKYEEITDKIEYEIAAYLAQVSNGELSPESADRVKRYYKIIGEMESLGDSGEAIGRMLTRKNIHNKEFSPAMVRKLNRMMDLVDAAFEVMITNLKNPHLTDIANAKDAEYNINELRNTLREEHMINLENGDYDYSTGVYYLDVVSELEKVGDFIINVSEASVHKV